eukprot:2835161-Pyramimonas_sp.AAC.1
MLERRCAETGSGQSGRVDQVAGVCGRVVVCEVIDERHVPERASFVRGRREEWVAAGVDLVSTYLLAVGLFLSDCLVDCPQHDGEVDVEGYVRVWHSRSGAGPRQLAVPCALGCYPVGGVVICNHVAEVFVVDVLVVVGGLLESFLWRWSGKVWDVDSFGEVIELVG